MAGFKVSSAGIKSSKQLSTSVPMPKGKSGSSKNFLKLRPPRKPGLKNRIYSKQIAKQDPTQYGDIGFGDTGLTGES